MFKPIVGQVGMRSEARRGARLGSCLEAPGGGGGGLFGLQSTEFLGWLGRSPEDHAPVELVLVRPMAALGLSIGLGVASRNLPVDDPEIPQVPGEIGPKL